MVLVKVWSKPLAWDSFPPSMPIIHRFHLFSCLKAPAYPFSVLLPYLIPCLSYPVSLLYHWVLIFYLVLDPFYWHVFSMCFLMELLFSIPYLFQPGPLWHFYICTESSFYILNFRCHFIQPHTCTFLEFSEFFPSSLGKFVHVFYKHSGFFDHIYGYSSMSCVLGFTYIIPIREHSYRLVGFQGKYTVLACHIVHVFAMWLGHVDFVP